MHHEYMLNVVRTESAYDAIPCDQNTNAIMINNESIANTAQCKTNTIEFISNQGNKDEYNLNLN